MIEIHPDERVILEIRRHWFVLFSQTIFLAILIFIPIALIFFPTVGARIWSSSILLSITIFVFGFWFLLVWILFFIFWTDYYLDVWVLTSRRIIDIEQHQLFHREVSEFRLDRIQDITIDVRGILPTLLHFGDIHVETAGETQKFIIKIVPHPDKIKDAIFKQQEQFVQSLYQKTS
jgi:energy-coupling factor transporter transmembrane protein EcfT